MNAGERDIVCEKEGEKKGSARGSVQGRCDYTKAAALRVNLNVQGWA
jgi:hypothetical protein